MYKIDALLEPFCTTNFDCYDVLTASSNISKKSINKKNISKNRSNPTFFSAGENGADMCYKDKFSCQRSSLV